MFKPSPLKHKEKTPERLGAHNTLTLEEHNERHSEEVAEKDKFDVDAFVDSFDLSAKINKSREDKEEEVFLSGRESSIQDNTTPYNIRPVTILTEEEFKAKIKGLV